MMRSKVKKHKVKVVEMWLATRGITIPLARSFVLGGACGIAFSTTALYIMHPSETQTAAAATLPARQASAAAVPEKVAAAVKAAEIIPALPVLPASVSLRVGNGDTLINILTDTGVSFEEATEAVAALRKVFDPRKLDVGSQVAVNLDKNDSNPAEPIIRSLSVPLSRTAMVELKRTQKGDFQAKKIEVPLIKKLVPAGGVITSSFYQTGAAAGIPDNNLAELIKIYSYDVDFQRDIKRGNKIEVLMERLQTEDGIVAGYGNVAYATLTLDNKKLSVYRYADKNGNVDYYNEKGESLRKALLRTPINGARITSGFGMRMHPILGYSKMHRGIDFGASTGTPIYAAGDGVIAEAGWKGAYGNYVQIKHDKKYSTAYAHASRIAKGIRPGARVKQGQVIAYVGTTGRSTGAHLHYEILAGGQQVNPSGVKFKTGNTLTGKELAAFKQSVEQVKVAMGGLKSNDVAAASALTPAR